MALNSSQFNITFNGGETNAVGLVNNLHAINYAVNPPLLADGTGANQAQKMVTLNPTITTSGTTYDLTAIAGGPNNANVNFGSVTIAIVQNTSATIPIILGNAASSIWEPWTSVSGSTYSIAAGGYSSFIFFDPSATGGTVDGTHKSLKLITGSSTAVAKIIVLGRGS